MVIFTVFWKKYFGIYLYLYILKRNKIYFYIYYQKWDGIYYKYRYCGEKLYFILYHIRKHHYVIHYRCLSSTLDLSAVSKRSSCSSTNTAAADQATAAAAAAAASARARLQLQQKTNNARRRKAEDKMAMIFVAIVTCFLLSNSPR